MPRGIFGTRADLFMDLAIVLLTALPFAMLGALRFARSGRVYAHRAMQTGLLVAVLVVLALFETDIRLAGGTRSYIAQSRMGAAILPLLRVHVAIALLTFVSWLALIVASWPRMRVTLPGAFSARHRAWGKVTFGGVCLMSATGAALYACVYLL
jgi:uncharacterized membrane protein YozB (DUF420 family)